MRSDARRRHIQRQLRMFGEVAVGDLMTQLQVSKATLYRDIQQLVHADLAHLNNGFVQLHEPNAALLDDAFSRDDPVLTYRLKTIAELAVQLIERNDSIFLDAGKISTYMAEAIAEDRTFEQITVVTNHFHVALRLFGHVQYLYLVGGQVDKHDDIIGVRGIKTADHLHQVYLSKAFVSPDGFDPSMGYSVFSPDQWFLLKETRAFAKTVCVVMPSNWIGRRCLHQLSDQSFPHLLITDNGLDKDRYRDELADPNITLLVARSASAET